MRSSTLKNKKKDAKAVGFNDRECIALKKVNIFSLSSQLSKGGKQQQSLFMIKSGLMTDQSSFFSIPLSSSHRFHCPLSEISDSVTDNTHDCRQRRMHRENVRHAISEIA